MVGRTRCGAEGVRRRARVGVPAVRSRWTRWALFGVVELECVGDAVDDALGDSGGVAAFETDVVLRRDTCQECDLLAAQAGDAATLVAIGGQTCLLRGDPGAPGGEELADLSAHFIAGVPGLVAGCHAVHSTSAAGGEGVTVGGPHERACHGLVRAGCLDVSTSGRRCSPDQQKEVHRR